MTTQVDHEMRADGQVPDLSPDHIAELDASTIDPAVREARRYETLYGTDEDKSRLRQDKIPVWAWGHSDSAFPGLFIPMYRVTGELIGHQFKPAEPQVVGDKPVKYASPADGKSRLDVPPPVAVAVRSPGTALWITEGIKKADALASRGLPVVSLTGVYNWRRKHGTLGDWEDIPLKERTVVICFDSDARTNHMVLLAMRRLGAWLESKGAASIHYLIVPEKVGDVPVKGVDDFFAAGGTLEGLRDATTTEKPSDDTRDAAFTDAVLVDRVCTERLESSYRWAKGLGWMKWDGRIWREATDSTVLEEIRQWGLVGFQTVLDEQRGKPSRNMTAQMDGWRGILAASKLSNLLKLAKGILEADPNEFDADPDALNVGNGILNLRTGALEPHDPDRLMTKIAGCDYVKGAVHPDWTKALEAVPEDSRAWFQVRMGQGITGHTPPDDVIMILQGSGSNAKSTVMDSIAAAAGKRNGYHTPVADRALLGSASDNHPTEMMDFLGARLAVLEETPEAKKLDVTRVKKLAGTEQIKARKIRQDSVAFAATHSLIINTNFKPLVEESDHGTWRRLAMLCFPYTFRKSGEPCTGPNDRPGDPNLRQRLRTDERAAEAVLAWLVDGARQWYDADMIMPVLPLRVEADTLAWRRESDLVLSFIGDVLSFDWNSHVEAVELREVFNHYLEDKGHRPWTDRTFAARFGTHDECTRNRVERNRIRPREGRSTLGSTPQKTNPYHAWLGVRFQDPGENQQVDEGEPEPVPTVPTPTDNREVGSRIGVSGTVGTAGTRPEPAPAEDRFAGDPFAEAESVRAAAPGAGTIPAARAEANVPQRPAGGSVGWDLESHSVKRLFTHTDIGGDPFVRLSGWVEADGTEIVANSPKELIERLEAADEIYGHNIIAFDLMALARHCGADYDKLAAKAMDTYRWVQTIDPPGSAHEKPWAEKGYYGLDKSAQRHGMNGKTDDLKALAFQYGPEELHGKKLNKDERTEEGFGRIPVNVLGSYFSGDLAATRGLRTRLGEPTDYLRREMRVAHVQHRPTLTGWKVDVPELERLARAEAERKRASLEWLHENCGIPLTKDVTRGRGSNKTTVQEPVPSPLSTIVGREAVIKALRERGVQHYPKTESGLIALNKDAMGEASYMVGKGAKGRSVPAMLNPNVLAQFAEGGADVDALREMCGHIVTVTSSVQKYEEIRKYVVGDRVHPEVGDVQGSGRWAYVHPSVTNLGKRGGKHIQRAPFIADDGEVLISFDLDQVDMRAIAGHCQDPAYMAMFGPGMDAHSMIADQVFGRHDGEWRDRAKRTGHGWNYGMSVNGLVNSGVERSVAEKFDDGMNERFPGLSSWRREVRDRGAAGQMLDNGFGRLMRCNPDRAWTQAPALMGQGGARDIMCEGLLRLVDRLPEALGWLRVVVHDEIVLSVPEDMVRGISEEVLDCFSFDFKGVPITAGASKAAKDWAGCYSK